MNRDRAIQVTDFEIIWFGLDKDKIIQARRILKEQEERRNATKK